MIISIYLYLLFTLHAVHTTLLASAVNVDSLYQGMAYATPSPCWLFDVHLNMTVNFFSRRMCESMFLALKHKNVEEGRP